MKRWQLGLVPLIAVLLLGVVFALVVQAAPPLSGAVPQLAGRARPVALPQAVTSTVYLPALSDNYDPDYILPFGYTTYADVHNNLGLQKMVDAGSGWVTTLLFWESIEPNEPVNGVHTYNWTAYDALALRAHTAGVNMIVLFSGNPPWAAQYDAGPVDGDDMVHLVSFVTAMAERYDGDGIDDADGSPVINYWSFYPEPDNYQAWRAEEQGKGLWGNNPQGYAALLAQISPAIHAANPNAKVLNGGLAYDWFTDSTPPGPFVQSFLGNVLEALDGYPGGASRYLDGVAFHYYPIRTDRWPTIREKTLEIKAILNQHGVGDLPLIVPEMGYWSAPVQGSSETRQAQALVQMYVRGFSVGIRHMSWFSVFDHGGDTETHGLFRNENLNDPKPAYGAYDVMTEELTPYRYLQPFSWPGVEGYVFRRSNGDRKIVLWSVSSPRSVDFTQECARVRGLLGTVQQITDGGAGDGDGQNNGKVRITIAVNHPTYVGACTAP